MTHFDGVEYKFDLPMGQLTTLLQTKDLIVRATPFPGELPAEQWIKQIVVDTWDGERIVDVKIRPDIVSFNRTQEMPQSFETLEVRATWWGEQLLTFPTKGEDIVIWGSFMMAGHPYEHPKNIIFDLVRIQHTEGMDASKPRREGVIITCESVKIMIVSTSAWEYYWEDSNDTRALKHSHLDFELLDMQNPSSFTGLLPEIWGLAPRDTTVTLSKESSQDATAAHTNQNPSLHGLRKQFLANLVAPVSDEASDVRNAAHKRGLKRQTLKDLLSPGGETPETRTTAGVHGVPGEL